MRPEIDPGVKQAIADCLAAIDLLQEQRRVLEEALKRAEQPIGTWRRTATTDRYHGRHRKAAPTTLIIKINGRTIAQPQAAAGMVKAIELIGPDRVQGLGLRLGGQELVVCGVEPHGRGYHQRGEYWIATHSSTAEKRDVLQRICRRLGLTGSIQQVARHAPTAA